jgi:hypothetical protein
VQAALMMLSNAWMNKHLRGCSSVVERQLPKLNVVGSIPITRFNLTRINSAEWSSIDYVKNLSVHHHPIRLDAKYIKRLS